jgi:L-lactate dehydrogenase complex protein LldE
MLTNTGYGSKAVPLVRSFVDVFGATTPSWRRRARASGRCASSTRWSSTVGDDRAGQRVEHLAPRVYELSSSSSTSSA